MVKWVIERLSIPALQMGVSNRKRLGVKGFVMWDEDKDLGLQPRLDLSPSLMRGIISLLAIVVTC